MTAYLRILIVGVFALSSAGCLTIPTGFQCATDDACPSGQTCGSDGTCIARTSCTLDADCPDGQTCGSNGECDTGTVEIFTCLSGLEIPRDRVCDGVEHCPDGDDESNCPDPHAVLCPGGAVMIDATQVCDSSMDCPGGEDEQFCMNCGGSPDVMNYLVHCDGVPDCDNGFDEAHCFHCGPGDNIRVGFVCDGFVDCPGSVDEPPSCVDIDCLDGEFVPAAALCDNDVYDVVGCMNGEDENPATCNPRRFTCPSTMLTIAEGFLCDGWPDCANAEDEDPANCFTVCLDGSRDYPPVDPGCVPPPPMP